MKLFQLFIALFVVMPLTHAGSFSYVEDAQWVEVSKVFDGDTFKTKKGLKVRLLGLNTPEVAHGSDAGQIMGETAKSALQGLIAGKMVRLRFDLERKDRYGRLLAQAWLRDGRWINGWLMSQGLAHVYTFAPNFHWGKKLLALEHEAIRARRGIWNTSLFSLLPSNRVSKRNIGQFRVVEGVIGQRLDKKGWYFRCGKLKVSVPRRYREWFDQPPALNKGAHVTIRGRIRISSKGQLFLALHSPLDIEINQ